MAYDVLDVSRHIINYSNECEYGISNLKLQKLLYFVQAFFILDSLGEKVCFHEKIEAWDFGPVVPEAYREYKQYGGGNIPPIRSYLEFNGTWDVARKPFVDIIPKEDAALIDAVVDGLSEYSATYLVEITHDQSPWKDAYAPKENNEITIEALKAYFLGEKNGKKTS